ncbi:NUDIX domain-containing protein [Nonomuraea sp. NPDC050310]|uniref:NUDIX hydrolase n=1 Tax=Nonomuraea sp. NPDC050310 TaxID=3154935 RepID=UPI0033E411FD
MSERRRRMAAYAVVLRHEEILLTRYVGVDEKHWTMPGGGVEFGEHPHDTVVRELAEETGFEIAVEGLLGVDSIVWTTPEGRPLHTVRLYYAARIVGGELRHEVGGSSDLAAWFPLAEVGRLDRSSTVESALRFHAERPASGHLAFDEPQERVILGA